MRRILLFVLACTAHAAVKLPALISDRMVLQQGMPVRIWGTADPGENVRVEFQGQSVSTKARENGKWEAWLRPLAVAGPLEMTITGTATTIIQNMASIATGANGQQQVSIRPVTTSDGNTAAVGLASNTIRIKDVLVGEVW